MITESAVVEAICLLGGYGLLGGGIKYIDQAHDVGVYSKKVALVFALLCGALMSFLIATDTFSALILTSIVVGVTFTKKIDNYAFMLGTIINPTDYPTINYNTKNIATFTNWI